MHEELPECLRGTDIELAQAKVEIAQLKVDALTLVRREMDREFSSKKSERAAEIDIDIKTETFSLRYRRRS